MAHTNETRRPAIECTIDVTDTSNPYMAITFGNGREITLVASDISAEIALHAMMHGLKQKLVDAAALSRNPDTGRAATIDDKYQAVLEVYNRLLSGSWNKGRGEAGGTKGGLLFRALCIMYPAKSPADIQAFLGKKSAAEKTALRRSQKVADIIATLKDDGGETDVDGLLDELN